ncbi:MAG: nickel-responsive transcriptional regulator NikR [Acidobacteriaceae bacterium]|nr:nickel-responsive transcriptional regulator NikR [Acidobacteriaceae bacterium]MBV9295160.1 nickel-responsive transcriptional regulator NikR [Acidobacteriaceae bacterium]MBV9766645.1 nickel-responsive transcriptional regulator NikR [Acidobacteriaceae bacterium]
MGQLTRTGIAIDDELLARFDRFIAKQGYGNRSEAFRDLIRDRLVGAALEKPEAHVVGTITLIYDHHSRLLPDKLMDLQHDHHHAVIATTHVHLDHDTCLEVLVVKGQAKQVQMLADLLIGTKGVRHGRLVMTSPSVVLTKTA